MKTLIFHSPVVVAVSNDDDDDLLVEEGGIGQSEDLESPGDGRDDQGAGVGDYGSDDEPEEY